MMPRIIAPTAIIPINKSPAFIIILLIFKVKKRISYPTKSCAKCYTHNKHAKQSPREPIVCEENDQTTYYECRKYQLRKCEEEVCVLLTLLQHHRLFIFHADHFRYIYRLFLLHILLRFRLCTCKDSDINKKITPARKKISPTPCLCQENRLPLARYTELFIH